MLLFHGTYHTQLAVIDLDPSFFINWGIFLLTTIALYQIILKPVLRISEIRHERTAGAKAEAAKLEKTAKEQVERYESLMAEASKEGKAGVESAREAAQAQSAATIKAAREKAKSSIDAEMPKLQAAYDENRAKLETVAENLSDSIVSKIVKSEAQA